MLKAPKFWYQKRGALAYTLSPLSVLYQAGTALHKSLYRLKIKKIYQFDIPVIVVGNLTVGGTGKTPFVIWLANWLKEKGYRPGIVTRGYGRKASGSQIVTENLDPKIVGDEAILIAQKTNCPVVVDANRSRSIKQLMTKSCNVIISDDGLQHHALARDIEIAVVDGDRQFGNGFCLPAGPLRESQQRLKSVDFIIQNGGINPKDFHFTTEINEAYAIKQPTKKINLKSLSDKPIHAVAGIGNPKRFFHQLKQLGLQVLEHPFPDHHAYHPKDLNFNDSHPILMTEKDAPKCYPWATDRHWVVPLNLTPSSQFEAALTIHLTKVFSNDDDSL